MGCGVFAAFSAAVDHLSAGDPPRNMFFCAEGLTHLIPAVAIVTFFSSTFFSHFCPFSIPFLLFSPFSLIFSAFFSHLFFFFFFTIARKKEEKGGKQEKRD